MNPWFPNFRMAAEIPDISIKHHFKLKRRSFLTFYQELQLNSAGSKELIRQAQDKKEKWRHILIYNFKVYLVVAFCFAVVSIYSMIFGSDNSVAGVVVLLALMVLRQVDFGIKTSHGVGVIFLIFGILAAGPGFPIC